MNRQRSLTQKDDNLEDVESLMKETPQNRGRNKSFLNSEKAISSVSKRKALEKKPTVQHNMGTST